MWTNRGGGGEWSGTAPPPRPAAWHAGRTRPGHPPATTPVTLLVAREPRWREPGLGCSGQARRTVRPVLLSTVTSNDFTFIENCPPRRLQISTTERRPARSGEIIEKKDRKQKWVLHSIHSETCETKFSLLKFIKICYLILIW